MGQVFSPVQSSLLSAIQTSTEENLFQGHEHYVFSVAFSPDSQYIVSGSSDKTVRLWRSGWKASLQVGCHRLRYHPVLKNPQTDVAKGARETCEKYVWRGQ